MSQTSDTPRTDAVTVITTPEARSELREPTWREVVPAGVAQQLERELNAAKHDIEAYRGALGYSVTASHDGKLTDGGTPQCGLCNSEHTRLAKEFYDKWQNDSSLETWFPITAEELEQLRAELATANAQVKKLKDHVCHTQYCGSLTNATTCTCGLSKLLEEIKA